MRTLLLAVTLAITTQLLVTKTLNAAPKAPAISANETDTNKYQGNPKSIELNESGAKAVKAKEFAQAEALFSQALDADSKNLTAAFNLASIYLTNKKEDQAVKLLEDYTTRYPNDAGLQARMGDAYFAVKKVKEASLAYERALALAPEYFGVKEKLGTIYLMEGKPKDSERLLRAAVSQDPKNPKLLANLSSVLLINGKAEEAITTAKRSLQMKPSNDAYVALGMAYESQKDYKSALIALQRAEDLGDTRPEVKERIAALKKVTAQNG